MDIDIENTDKPTLQTLARETFTPLNEAEITDALTKAGIDPKNERERERFRHLVAAHTHTYHADEIGRIGEYYDRAESENPDADPQDILNEARMLAWVHQMEREQEEDFYRD